MYKQRARIVIVLLLLNFLGQPSFCQFLSLKFDHITSKDGLPHSTIHGITKDKYGFMWFGTWSGLCRYDGYKLRIYRSDPNNPKSIFNNRIHNLLTDSKGDVWILTFDDKFLSRYNYKSDDFDRVNIEDAPKEIAEKILRRTHKLKVNYTFQQHKWHLDSYTTTVVETHLPSGKSKSYFTDPLNPWSINDTYVSDIYLDDQYVLWLGTYSKGMNRTYLQANPFYYLYHNPTSENSIAENTVRSICEDQEGNLWVATRSKGISVIKKNGEYQHVKHHSDQRSSIQSDYIKKVFCDSKGYVWIGSQKGVDRYTPVSKQISRLEIPGLDNVSVFAFAEDKHNNVWLATWNGIFKYDRLKDTFIHFNTAATLPHKHVWCIHIDSKQQVWAGTEGGGIAILKETKNNQLTVINQLSNTDPSLSLSDNRIYAILEDKQQNIWIGTGNGLDLYVPGKGEIKHLSHTSTLWPKGTIAGIMEDNNGFIWVSHKQGISKIDATNLSIRTFEQQDGLQSNEFTEGAIYKSSRSNLLYFGGNDGLNYFNPDSIRTNQVAPKVVLTELQILNKPVEVNTKIHDRIVLQKPLYMSSSLQLIHADKSISIEFAALHYTNPEGNKYAYMLEGFDKEWIYTDAKQRVANYSNLAPGKYTFKVKASNSDGLWAENPTLLHIAVAPPIWASTMAYILYSLVFLAILYALYHYLIRLTRLKSKLIYEAILRDKDSQLHESKVQFFTNISHEIKTPLTLILSPIQQLKGWSQHDDRMQEQLRTMENNGNRLLKTVNQLLDIRRFETGHEKLHLEETDIVILLRKVLDSFAQEARQKKIRLKFVTIHPSLYLLFDPDKIEKVLYNLLSNALKFTGSGGTIKVRLFITKSSFVRIDVVDNGRGISEEDLARIFDPFAQGKDTVSGGSGVGLTYSKSLAEMHGGTLSAQSRMEEKLRLTVFSINLPLQTTYKIIRDSSKEITTVIADIDEENTEPLISLSDGYTVLPKACTLLLVEDNDEMRRYLASFFRKDYQILEATNGEEGISMAREYLPDLVISDVMMPKVDGISFTRQVKSDILLRHIPVILLTARTLLEYEIEGLETGADDYMVKPFNLQVLALKIRNQLIVRFQMLEKFKQKISIEPAEIDLQSPDDVLLQKILIYVEENISDSELNIDKICQSIGLSRTQLYRKMKALTGYSMADLTKEIRLKRAEQLLRNKKFNISEIAYMVGFTDPDYFRKCFKLKYGQSPTEYAKRCITTL